MIGMSVRQWGTVGQIGRIAALCALAQPGLAAPLDGAMSVCRELVAGFPTSWTVLPGEQVADVIAAWPGTRLNLKPDRPGGLELRSTYQGTLGCQRNSLYRNDAGKDELIAIPASFAGGDGELCRGDQVSLVTQHGRPVLLEVATAETAVTLTAIARSGSGWTDPCDVAIALIRRFGVRKAFCDGDRCAALADAVIREADVAQQDASVDSDNVKWTDYRQWMHMMNMVRKAKDRGEIHDDIVTLGQKPDDIMTTLVGWDTRYFAIYQGGRLLVGEIGTAGFGSHFGEDRIANVYRVDHNLVRPVAGFYLQVVGRVLSNVEVHDH